MSKRVLFLVFLFLWACNFHQEKQEIHKQLSYHDSISLEDKQVNLLKIRYIVLPFDSHTFWVFPKQYKNASLSTDELKNCETLIAQFANSYSKAHHMKHPI